MAINFSAQFIVNEKTSTRVLRLTDTSTGFTLSKGNFSVTFPDGSVISNTDFSSPEISAPGGNTSVSLITDIDNTVLTGVYVVNFVALDTSLNTYNKTETFDFNWEKPTKAIINDSDVVLPEVQFKDLTAYETSGSFTGVLTRNFFTTTPSTSEVGVITKTSVGDILTPSNASKYYEGIYLVSSDVSVLYTHTSKSWLTVSYVDLLQETYDVREAPTQDELVALMNTYKDQIEAYKTTNPDEYARLNEEYDLVLALYSHIIARYQTSTLDGSKAILDQLLGLLPPASSYTYKATLMLPFTINFTTSLTGSGTTGTIPKFTGATSLGNSIIKEDTARIGIGKTPTTTLDVNGAIQGTSIVKAGGTSSQFLKADGSVDTSTYLTGVAWGSITGTLSTQTDLQTALDLKAPLASPTFTGTVSGITKSMVGLSNVDNTTDLLKPISTATQTALDLKAPLVSPTFTGTVSGVTKSMVGLSNVDNTTDLLKPISTATQTALDLKAPLASPTFTGTVSGVTKSMVGLSNVDNTSDANKPVSSATQTALNLKYDASNPSGYISGITSGQVTTALGFTPENAANKGINNGYASLDGAGKVLSSQLPSYVDDVVEVANYAALPATGETGKIYVTIDTNYIYRWTGSVYVEIKDSSAVWGAITGTLSNQTDLQNALDAKLSVTTAASTYVPYTGATTNLVLGDNNFSAKQVSILKSPDGFGGFTSNYLFLQTGTSTTSVGTDGISLVSKPNVRALIINYDIAGVNRSATLDADLLTASRTFQFPNASGTIALTSDLSAYVPYTGATGNVDLGTHSLIASQVKASSSAGLSLNSNNGTQVANLGAGGGANITFYGGLTGTTATFAMSGSGIALGVTGSGTGDAIRITHSSGRALTLNSSGSGYGVLINNETASTSAPFTIQKQGLAVITLTDAGAGSFSSSLTASSFVKTSGTSAQFLKADGSVDSSTYLTTSSAASTYVPYTGATGAVNLGAFDLTVNTIRVGKGAGNIADNTVVGASALNSNTTGTSNTAVGYLSLFTNTTGGGNSSFGVFSLLFNLTGSNNTAIGGATLYSNTTGGANVAIGLNALYSNTTGGSNTANGVQALYGNTSGIYNTAIGSNALNGNTTANYNTAVGNNALLANTTGASNTAVGNNAGQSITTGSNNVIIGGYAGTSAMSNNIVLSDGAGNIKYQWNGTTNTLFGTTTLTGALSGTSATFTGLTVSNTSDVYPEIKTSAVDADAFLGFSNTGDGNAAWSIGRRNTGEFWISTYTGNFNSGTRTEPLKIATSGAATFSSSVTASGGVIAGDSKFFNTVQLTDSLGGTCQGFLWTDAANTLKIGTGTVAGGNVKMTIASTGAATFSSSVTASDYINVKKDGSDTAFSGSYLSVSNAANNVSWGWQLGASNKLSLWLYNGGPTSNPLNITTTGNVGIGTTAPTAKLEVNGYGTANSIMTYVAAKFYGAGTGGINLGTDGTNPQIATDSSGVDLTFLTRVSGVFSERMRITSGGNVGIGTTAPNGKLEVSSDQSSNNQHINIIGTQTSFNQGYSIGIPTSTKDLRFYDLTVGTERMRITSGGNVGIGTASGLNAKLEIGHDGYGTTNTYSGIHIKNTNTTVDSNVAARLSFSGDGNASMAGIIEQRRDGIDSFWIRTLNGYSADGRIYVQAQTNGVYLAKDATSWTSNSDERMKADLVPIENASEKVSQLRSVIGRYKTDEVGTKRSFLIAQDVLSVLPEAVDIDSTTGMMGVQYTEVIPLLVASIKELKAELDTLKNK
jgi:hypothetical protein